MRYLYRCDCGWDAERFLPMSEPVPETWDWGEHPTGPPGESRVLCVGMLRRVYEPTMLNLGAGPRTSPYDDYRFRNL